MKKRTFVSSIKRLFTLAVLTLAFSQNAIGQESCIGASKLFSYDKNAEIGELVKVKNGRILSLYKSRDRVITMIDDSTLLKTETALKGNCSDTINKEFETYMSMSQKEKKLRQNVTLNGSKIVHVVEATQIKMSDQSGETFLKALSLKSLISMKADMKRENISISLITDVFYLDTGYISILSDSEVSVEAQGEIKLLFNASLRMAKDGSYCIDYSKSRPDRKFMYSEMLFSKKDIQKEIKSRSKGIKSKGKKGSKQRLSSLRTDIFNSTIRAEKLDLALLDTLLKRKCSPEVELLKVFDQYCSILKDSASQIESKIKEFDTFLSAYQSKWPQKKREVKLRRRNIQTDLPDVPSFKLCDETTKLDLVNGLKTCCIDTCSIVARLCQLDTKKFTYDHLMCSCEEKVMIPQHFNEFQSEFNFLLKMGDECNRISVDYIPFNYGKNLWIKAAFVGTEDDKEMCFGSVSSERSGYGRGKYDLPVDFSLFVDSLFGLLKRMASDFNWNDTTYKFLVVGYADGYGFNQKLKKIEYKGYGDDRINDNLKIYPRAYSIVKNASDITDLGMFNDNFCTFSIENSAYQKIQSNEELAYLRAFPILQLYDRSFNPLINGKIYTVCTDQKNEIGTHRRVEFYMMIPNILKENDFSQSINNDPWFIRMNKW